MMVKPGIDSGNSGNTSLDNGNMFATDGIASFLTGNDIQPDGKAVGNTRIEFPLHGVESRYCGNDFPHSGIDFLYCEIES